MVSARQPKKTETTATEGLSEKDETLEKLRDALQPPSLERLRHVLQPPSVELETELRAAERDAETMKASYQEIVGSITNGIAVYRATDDGLDFRLTDLNPAGEQLSASKREEILGRSVQEVFPGVKAMGLFDVFQRVWRTGLSEALPPLYIATSASSAGWPTP